METLNEVKVKLGQTWIADPSGIIQTLETLLVLKQQQLHQSLISEEDPFRFWLLFRIFLFPTWGLTIPQILNPTWLHQHRCCCNSSNICMGSNSFIWHFTINANNWTSACSADMLVNQLFLCKLTELRMLPLYLGSALLLSWWFVGLTGEEWGELLQVKICKQ